MDWILFSKHILVYMLWSTFELALLLIFKPRPFILNICTKNKSNFKSLSEHYFFLFLQKIIRQRKNELNGCSVEHLSGPQMLCQNNKNVNKKGQHSGKWYLYGLMGGQSDPYASPFLRRGDTTLNFKR